ncbi:MAG: Nramp family divalent metal transporter [Thermoanaerobaculia bacterium]
MPRLLSRNLPAVEIRDLPEPRPLWLLLGPGVIILATSLGSGETYFWPGITMKYGFTLLWPALIAFSLQYVLNTEFARYTIATGETVVTGFTRLWRPLAWFFLAAATLPWLWPGWSMGGASALSWVVDGRPELIAAISLIVTGVALSGTRVVYQAVERIEKALLLYIVIAVGIVCITVVGGDSVRALGEGLTTVPTSLPPDLSFSTLLAALAFCGAGGSINLAVSHWVRDKDMGMAAHVPRVTSPLTGAEIPVGAEGYFFEPTDGNLERWQGWWRVTRREHMITFLGMGLIGLILLMLASHSLLYGRDLPFGLEMLQAEGEAIGQRTAGGMTIAFYLAVAAVFFTSAVGVLDHVARLSADILKMNVVSIRGSRSRYLSESALYFVFLWLMIAFALVVLFVGNIRDAPTLLQIAGSLSGIVMFVYSLFTIPLMLTLARDAEAADRRFARVNPFRLPRWRLAALALAVVFYGGFSVLLVVNLVRDYMG